MKKNLLIALFLFILFSLATVPAYAQESIVDPEDQCIETGDCQLNDFLEVGVRIAKMIWGLSGSLALLAFIYGGFVFLTSAGNQNRVSQGKQIIFGALIGLAIIFLSYIIIGFIITQLIPDAKGQWFQSGWFKGN